MRRRRRIALAGAAAVAVAGAFCLPCPALAHHATAHVAGAPWRQPPDMLIVALLATALWLYASGLRRLWRQAGRGRVVSRAEAAAFAAGWLTLAAALLPPVHVLGESLFWMHMVEHELVMAVAAPLLVLGRPLLVMLWALPPAGRRRVGAAGTWKPVRVSWNFLTGSLAAFAVHGLALWLWHVPVLFEAALRNEAMHALQHASFLAAALLYWSSLLQGSRRRGATAERGGSDGTGQGAAVLSLFATTLHTGVLGALLTLGAAPWYAAYGNAAAAWGLTPIEDQQLAGLVMWVPGGFVYTGAALVLVTAWLRDAEARTHRWERALPKEVGRA
jgi:putative membrane protein